MGRVFIVAHRGASGYQPENTLRAVNNAVNLGVDMVEVDVRLSKDENLIVIHDETVDRTTNGTGYVKDMSLENLRKLDAGMGEKLPILEEVIDAVKGKTRLVVELKEHGMEKKIVKVFEHKGVVEDVFVTSFLHQATKKVKELNPHIKTGVIIRCEPVNPSQLALNADADSIFVEYKYATLSMVEDCRKKGLSLLVWTVDEPVLAERFISMGVDGLVTNKPDILTGLKTERPKKVFIAGPIQGVEKKQFYRKKLRNMLEAYGFEVLDPWEREKIVYSGAGEKWWEEVPAKSFIKRDLADIERCDFFIAYLPKISAGTCMELFYAKSKNKPAFIVSRLKNLSPWVKAHSTKILKTFKDLEEFLKNI